MPTRRFSRVSTGRRRTWMSAMLRATSLGVVILVAVLHVLGHHLADGGVRPPALGHSPHGDVPVGDHADQAVALAHRHDAGVHLSHQLRRIPDGLVRLDQPHVPCHDFSYTHIYLHQSGCSCLSRSRIITPATRPAAARARATIPSRPTREWDRPQARPPPVAASSPRVMARSTSTWVSGVTSIQMACTSPGSACLTFSICPGFACRDRIRNTAWVALRASIGPGLGQLLADGLQERVKRAGLLVHAPGGMPLVIVEAAHQERQLRAEMHGQLQRNAVAHRAQDRAEHVPGGLPVGADLRHQFVEPDVGGLQCLVEDVETSRAHGKPPETANAHEGNPVGGQSFQVALTEVSGRLDATGELGNAGG